MLVCTSLRKQYLLIFPVFPKLLELSETYLKVIEDTNDTHLIKSLINGKFGWGSLSYFPLLMAYILVQKYRKQIQRIETKTIRKTSKVSRHMVFSLFSTRHQPNSLFMLISTNILSFQSFLPAIPTHKYIHDFSRF